MQQSQLEVSVCAQCTLLRYLHGLPAATEVETTLSITSIDEILVDERRGPGQMREVIDWLRSGELPGYSVAHATATRYASHVVIVVDCHATPPAGHPAGTALLVERLEHLLFTSDIEDYHIRVRRIAPSYLLRITINEALTHS